MKLFAGSTRLQWFWALVLYLAAALLTTVPGIGATSLIKMEGMVADVSTAMLATGDAIVPRLFGAIYTYKPPLVYWLTAASIHWGGHTEWALRLPSALAVVVMGLAVLLAVGRLTRPSLGLLAGLAAIGNMMIFSKSKLAEFDAILACAVGIAVVAACYNFAQGRRRGSLAVWLTCYLALAAAFLAKGPPALMAFGPGLVAAALATGRGRELLGWRHLVGVAVFIGVAGLYVWQLWNAAGAEAFAQPLAEARERGLDWTWATFARTLLKPFLIMAGFLPWSLAWPWSRLRGESDGEPVARDQLSRAGLAFLAAGALVFMAVPTFEPRYFLPLSVAGAIVAVSGLERGAAASRGARRLAIGLATLCALLLVVAAVAALPPAVRIGSGAFGAAALFAVWILLPRWPRQRVVSALMVAACCGWVAETLILRPDRARAREVRPAAAELRRFIASDETLWAFGTPDEVGTHGNVFFYLERPVRVFLEAGREPAVGSPVLLDSTTRGALSRQDPELFARLDWVHTAGYRGRELLLYRLQSRAPAGP